jgi:hypothetical protein
MYWANHDRTPSGKSEKYLNESSRIGEAAKDAAATSAENENPAPILSAARRAGLILAGQNSKSLKLGEQAHSRA